MQRQCLGHDGGGTRSAEGSVATCVTAAICVVFAVMTSAWWAAWIETTCSFCSDACFDDRNPRC